MFRELLDFLGVDVKRIKFAWVSASEGQKWADTVDEFTGEIRRLGPQQYGELVKI